MSNPHSGTTLQSHKVMSLSLEDVLSQRIALLCSLVVLVVLTSGMVVGFRWWALTIHP